MEFRKRFEKLVEEIGAYSSTEHIRPLPERTEPITARPVRSVATDPGGPQSSPISDRFEVSLADAPLPGEMPSQSYCDLARSVGWSGIDDIVTKEESVRLVRRAAEERAAKVEAFAAFLRDNGIEIYDEPTVRKYMNDMVRKMEPTPQGQSSGIVFVNGSMDPDSWSYGWEWFPLEGRQRYGGGHQSVNRAYRNSFEYYAAPIPEPVLLTAKFIKDAYPEAKFDVSDVYQIQRGDPFLRVVYLKAAFIIERWDEPSFRG